MWIYVSTWETVMLASDMLKHKSCLSVCWVLLPFRMSDCRRTLEKSRSNKRGRRQNESLIMQLRMVGQDLWWQFLSFSNATTPRQGPGCQDVEDIRWAAGESCFHGLRQNSYHLTFWLSCRQFAGKLWFNSAVRTWLKLCITLRISPCIKHNSFWLDLYLLSF